MATPRALSGIQHLPLQPERGCLVCLAPFQMRNLNARKMQLDIDKTFEELEPTAEGLRDAILDIGQHSTSREAEMRWLTDLRLLTSASKYTEKALSDKALSDTTNEREQSPSPEDDYCSCKSRKDRKFNSRGRRLKLLAPNTLPNCVHYMAVSYCWNSHAGMASKGEPFTVQDGSLQRDLKCPPAVLARVIRFAAARGCKYIWIDQESIDQDDEEDKQVGIRAMDLVFQCAQTSVAVLELRLREQRHIDALHTLMNFPPRPVGHQTMIDFVETLEMISSDPWLTRAWTLQEATSATRSMSMILRYASHLTVPSSLGSDGDLAIDMSTFTLLLAGAVPLHFGDLQNIDAALSDRGYRFIGWWFDRNLMNWTIGRDIHTRPVCNGAKALWLLKSRVNSIVSDRLGILANLCGYDIRLDATKIERRGHGSSLAALVLALLNGDITVLAGRFDAKASGAEKRPGIASDPRGAKSYGFSWCPPKDFSLPTSILDTTTDASLKIQVLSLSPRGLQISGCIWIADAVLDLSQIQTLAITNSEESPSGTSLMR